MTSMQYEKWTKAFRIHGKLTKGLLLVNKMLTAICYVLFPLLIIVEFANGSSLWIRSLLTAGISFVLVSIFRKIYNKPRPYEALSIDPLIHKETKGNSFPSRHVFSVFVIAMCYFVYCKPLGILLFVAGVFMAIVRVLGGVHYPIDVIVGAVTGILSGLIGFYILS